MINGRLGYTINTGNNQNTLKNWLERVSNPIKTINKQYEKTIQENQTDMAKKHIKSC